jgi:hypothetical protein
MFVKFLSDVLSQGPKLIFVSSQIPLPILEGGLVRVDQTTTLNQSGASSTTGGRVGGTGCQVTDEL